MIHIFDTEIAQKYGVNAAILLQNFGFWIKQNEANEINYYDGNYWTYNSRRAFKELFPYMSERQIYTAIQKLIDDGLVITGNYNKLAYDRTLWYALTQKGKCILHFDTMENDKMSNGNNQNVKPIPDVNTDNKPDVNTDKKNSKEKSIDYVAIANAYKEICTSFPVIRHLSEARKKAIKARINSGYTQDDFITLFTMAQESDFLKGKNDRKWSADCDWLIKDSNMAKVLDGKYANKDKPAQKYNYDYGQEGVDYL